MKMFSCLKIGLVCSFAFPPYFFVCSPKKEQLFLNRSVPHPNILFCLLVCAYPLMVTVDHITPSLHLSLSLSLSLSYRLLVFVCASRDDERKKRMYGRREFPCFFCLFFWFCVLCFVGMFGCRCFLVSCFFFTIRFLHSFCFAPEKAQLVFFSFALCTGHHKTMKSLSFAVILFISLSIWLCIDGKSGSKSGSKKGSKGNQCFEDPNECTSRMTSAKGSKQSIPYTIWCKEETMEVCRAKEPKRHSIRRYEEGRCSICSLVIPPSHNHHHPKSKQKNIKTNRHGNHGSCYTRRCYTDPL